MHQKIFFILLAIFACDRGLAADFSYAGTFSQDDEERVFNFSLRQPAKVVIRTLSYGGGINSAGERLARGGFDPTLSLFDANGALVAVNRDGGCEKAAPDPVTLQCWDAFIEVQLPAGSWRVVLTQSENVANGPDLSGSFAYSGSGNFTASPEVAGRSGFWDLFPDRRSSFWAVDIRGADASQAPLTPNSGILNGASLLPGAAGPNTIMSLFDAQLNGDPGLTVSIDGLKAAVLYAGSSQINFAVPPGILPKTGARLNLLRGQDLIRTASLDITEASPALFTNPGTGVGQVAMVPAEPAKRESYISVFGTGFGEANVPGEDGLSWLIQPVTATIGGVPAQVVFAGLAPNSTMALQQINILIPGDCPIGPAVSIRLRAGLFLTQSGTTLAIE